MKITGKHLLVLVAMCGLLASGVGLVTNVSGLFFTPVAEEFGVGKGAASLMATICNIAFAFGGMFVPRILSEKTLKPLLIGATVTLAASTAALCLCPGIVPMYALCVLRGVAAGLLGFVFVTTVLNNWFVANIGLATSIAMGCSGIAGAAFSPVVSGVIGSAGWRGGFVMVGILTVILNLPAILFLPSVDPKTKGLAPLGGSLEPRESTDHKANDGKALPIDGLVFAAVLGYALLSSAATALPQHFPGLAETYALDAAAGATMLSACMVANTAGKILLGALIDRIGTKISVLIYAALVALALVMLLFVHGPIIVVVAAALFGLCYALATVGISMLTRDAFGLENYGKTYPTISLVGNIANASFASIVGFMFDFSGGYTSTLIMFLVMMVALVGTVVFVYARRPATAVVA